MEHRRTRSTAWLVLTSLVLFTSCGDGSSPTRPTTPPPAPVSTVIAEGSFQIGTILTAIQVNDPCDFLEIIEFQTSATGTIEAIVDWTFERNDLDVVITRGQCTCDLIAADACVTVVESLSSTAKPERVTATNQPAGTYTLVVANFDDEPESGSYQVIVTR